VTRANVTADAIHAILSFQVAFAIVVVAQVLIAFIGHNMIHSFERITSLT